MPSLLQFVTRLFFGEYTSNDVRDNSVFIYRDKGEMKFKDTKLIAAVSLNTLATRSGGGGAPLSNVSPVNITRSTANAGIGLEASRNDHKHDADIAIKGTGNPNGIVNGVYSGALYYDQTSKLFYKCTTGTNWVIV
jgi:hypothetical protein